jgi:hypothetical protein
LLEVETPSSSGKRLATRYSVTQVPGLGRDTGVVFCAASRTFRATKG